MEAGCHILVYICQIKCCICFCWFFVAFFVVQPPHTWANVFAGRNAFGKSYREWLFAGSKCVNLQVWKLSSAIQVCGCISSRWGPVTIPSDTGIHSKWSEKNQSIPAWNESGWVNVNWVFCESGKEKEEMKEMIVFASREMWLWSPCTCSL